MLSLSGSARHPVIHQHPHGAWPSKETLQLGLEKLDNVVPITAPGSYLRS
jgi:hypothetical protein